MERGLTMADMRTMQVGQIVDFCIAWNDRQTRTKREAEKPAKRRATQNDINAFFG